VNVFNPFAKVTVFNTWGLVGQADRNK